MNKFEKAFGSKVLQWRIPIIIFSLVFVVLAASGSSLLTFTTNYRVYFSEDNPQLKAFDALENTYSKNDNVMLVIAPKSGNIFTNDGLSLIEELTQEAWQTPYSTRVDSISNFQHTEAVEDDLIVRDLVQNAANLAPSDINHIREVTLAEPLLVNRLVSEKGHVSAINITVQLPGLEEAAETPEVVTYIRKLVAKTLSKHPDNDIYVTGIVMMNNAFAESSKSDMQSLIPISLVLMLAILALMVGGFHGTLSTLLVIALSIISALGIGARLGLPLTPASVTAPTIILTVAIANCVHILSTFLLQLQLGESKKQALAESLRINLQPVFLACFTTALGFLALNASEVPPFRDLGNFVAIGVLIAFVLSVTFLPALMSLLPARTPHSDRQRSRYMVRLGEFVIRFRRRLMWGITALMVLLILAIPRNELNDVFVHYFDTSISFRSDSDFTTNNLTGIYAIDYSIESGEPGGISNPEFQREVAAFEAWYKQQPEVLHINSYTDIMTRLNKNMHGDQPQWYRLPENRELAAQYLLLYEMSLPYGLDLNNQINLDKSATRFIVSLKTLSTNEILDLEQRVQSWLAANTRHIQNAKGTGTVMMFAHIGKRNIISMLFGTSIVLVLISVFLMLAFRSVKIGLISLAPNLLPAAAGFGLWGLFYGEVGLSLSVVISMTLGIVVDDTVHFLSKYLRARREQGISSEDAVRYAFKSVGHALLTTTIILVCGFLVLAISSFRLNSDMGLLTAIVISIALAVDFLLLPPVLMKFEEKKHAQMDSSRAMSDRLSG